MVLPSKVNHADEPNPVHIAVWLIWYHIPSLTPSMSPRRLTIEKLAQLKLSTLYRTNGTSVGPPISLGTTSL